MKRIILSLATVALTSGLMAQDSGFSAGLDFQLPMGDFGDLFSLGVGPAVGYEVELGDQGLFGGTAGYSILSSKEDFVTSGKMIHLTAHYKYFFSDIREGAYVAPMLGYGLVGYKFELNIPGIISSSSDESLGGLSFGAGVGYVVNERIDIGLRYQVIRATADGDATASAGESSTGLGFVGIRAMYNF